MVHSLNIDIHMQALYDRWDEYMDSVAPLISMCLNSARPASMIIRNIVEEICDFVDNTADHYTQTFDDDTKNAEHFLSYLPPYHD